MLEGSSRRTDVHNLRLAPGRLGRLSDTGTVAIVLTVIVTAALLVIAVFTGITLSHKLFPLENRSSARARRVRKAKLWVLGYVGLLLVLGLIIWGITGSFLAGVFAPIALMSVAPLMFQFARPSVERRLAKRRSDRRSSDSR